MITLQTLMNGLKVESLNEIVAGGGSCGGGKIQKSKKTKKTKKVKTTHGHSHSSHGCGC